MLGMGLFAGISTVAKNLFSGEAKAARQERKELKKAAKEKAKEAKEAAKEAILSGSEKGAKAGAVWAKIQGFFKDNWLYILIGAVVIAAVWFMWKGRKRTGGGRRRSGGSRGSAAMKARMAKVRAARRRKK